MDMCVSEDGQRRVVESRCQELQLIQIIFNFAHRCGRCLKDPGFIFPPWVKSLKEFIRFYRRCLVIWSYQGYGLVVRYPRTR